MADKLTPQQHQAVYDRGGKLLVSAAAGSGKTKVLVDRLMSYLTDPHDPANMDDFLIITYTKAAAAELRGKIAAKLTERIAEEPHNRHLQKQLQHLYLTKISTVHGFCSDILREYAYRLDIPADFRVADENESRELRDQVMNALLDRAYQNIEDPDFRAFVDSQGLGRDDRFVPEIVESVYNSAKCHLDPESWLDNCLGALETQSGTDVSGSLWGRFLMDDLREYLHQQIQAFCDLLRETDTYPELNKVSVNLHNTVRQMQLLMEMQTWDSIVQNKKIDFGRLVFPKNNPDMELAEQIKAVRNACKKGLDKKLLSFTDSSSLVIEDLKQMSSGTKGLISLVRQFDKDYASAKRSRRCLDFSDLEHKTLDLFLGKSRNNISAAANEIASRFREIMVDEYQDSNGVQDAIFSALTNKRQNCFLVGDVKQSIYQFRLADPGIFLEKYHAYTPAEYAVPGEGRKILLSHNFRSGPEVVDAVNDVFSICMRPRVGGLAYGEAEALREGIPHEKLPDPAVELHAIDVQEETYPEEASYVAEQIYSMLKTGKLIRKNDGLRPVQPEDIVILLRSPGSAASYFQHALEARGIRCSTGSGEDLLKTQEIATFRSFLKTILNPRQDIPLISTLASPVFGFTADDLASIRAKQKHGFFYDALLNDESIKSVNFLLILEKLRKEARMNTLTGLLEQCFSLTRMDSIYAAMPSGQVKRDNLQKFYQLAVDFEKGSLRDLSQFLDHLDALEDRGLVASDNNAAGTVTIMSIHKSKGLEFPVVFLCNLSRKFNQENLRGQVLCDKNLGLGLSITDLQNRIRYPSIAKKAISVKMAQESVSEEMRVLYVAMTRARDRLIMTYASRTLAADLQEIALRQDVAGGDLLCEDAICLGDWVLMAALKRTEAGSLHAFGARPKETSIGRFPWKIQVGTTEIKQITQAVPEEEEWAVPEDSICRLEQTLSFSYPYKTATLTPSKQTATGRKGRQKDAEAAEKTDEAKMINRQWRLPSFCKKEETSIAYGNAIHAAMQYIQYEKCVDLDGIKKEIRRLEEQKFLSAEQASMVDCSGIAAFFETEIGKKLRNGAKCLREFKFSILDDGIYYDPKLCDERILLQGVIDCAILEPDGIIILDFKTDKVNEQTLEKTVDRYRPQVQTYAQALSRIYETPVKQSFLYFFRINRFVAV